MIARGDPLLAALACGGWLCGIHPRNDGLAGSNALDPRARACEKVTEKP
jgi:hypothetical protein